MSGSSPRLRRALVALLLGALTLALYWRTGRFEFVNFDDRAYVLNNPGVLGGLSWHGLRWAFTSGYAANWHPLTWLSHQLDVSLFGLDAGAHHRTNALLHALNAALCFLALARLTGAELRSAFVAALFALHPMRVESVAWVAERKDLLCAAFTLGALLAYAAWARDGGRRRYLASLALFALALLAKPMAVTLPCVLLLLDVWPLGRLGPRPMAALVREKLPFLALAAGSSVVTFLVQRAGGAVGPSEAIPPTARLANSFEAYAQYAAKTFWPTGLCVFHPHAALTSSGQGPWTTGVLAALAALVLATLVLLGLRRRAPWALAGWLLFLGMLVPVIGLVQVGGQAWAERYSYLPSIGLGILVVWSAVELVRGARARRALVATGLVVLGLLTAASVRQIDTWRNGRTLFEHCIATEESALAHLNLMQVLEADGDLAGAERHNARALELQPWLASERVRRGRYLKARGALEEALEELRRATRDDPRLATAEADLGWTLAELGRDAEALPHLRRAWSLDPEDLGACNSLAWVLATSASAAAPEEALALAETLCARTGNRQASTLETRAAALARLGRFEEACRWQEAALARVPDEHRARLAERLRLYRAGQAYRKTP